MSIRLMGENRLALPHDFLDLLRMSEPRDARPRYQKDTGALALADDREWLPRANPTLAHAGAQARCPEGHSDSGGPRAMSKFQTTRWSLIAAARDSPEQARAALDQLCRAYRPPVLAFVRSSGYAPGDAEDLTQAFFLHFLERGWYADADPLRGRFRTLLLVSLRNFLHDQHAQACALKRGAQHRADDAALDDLPGDESPEQAFTRAWLGTVLGHAMRRLEREWIAAGKRDQFEQLAPLLVEHAEASELRQIAATTGMRSNTIAVQAHRMRQRLRQLVRLELLQTVGSGEALELELSELREALEATAAPTAQAAR